MNRYERKLPPLDPCPVEHVVEVVGGRWKARILHWLTLGEASVADLRRHLPRARHQVLAHQLAEMERHGLVRRQPPAPGRSWGAYAITPRGLLLHGALAEVAAWGVADLGGWDPPARDRGSERG